MAASRRFWTPDNLVLGETGALRDLLEIGAINQA